MDPEPKPQTLGIRGIQGLGRVQGLGPRLQDSGPIAGADVDKCQHEGL